MSRIEERIAAHRAALRRRIRRGGDDEPTAARLADASRLLDAAEGAWRRARAAATPSSYAAEGQRAEAAAVAFAGAVLSVDWSREDVPELEAVMGAWMRPEGEL